MALPTGTIIDRYRIESVLAAGGFGITYRALHEGLGHVVAIKEHFPRQFAYRETTTSAIKPTDPETFTWALDRFFQEGQALAKCRHPNVVSVADVFRANDTAYMVLGFEEGRSFRSWLEELRRPPTQDELDALLVPLLSALEYVHSQGLLHRDIAPDNIMIRRDGTPCLIDFGAARQAVAERSQMMSAIVKSGYSPPEQYTRSGRSQGPWSDIYALGATLYRAVSGTTPQESTERQVDDDLRAVRDLVDGSARYRSKFLAGIDEALRLRYSERPQTIAAWRSVLLANDTQGSSQAQTATAVAGPETKPPSKTGKPEPNVDAVTFTQLPSASQSVPRSRLAPLAGFVVAGMVLAILAVWWLGNDRQANLGSGSSLRVEEQQKRTEEERARLEAQKRAEEENAKAEAQRRIADEQARIELQKRADEDRAKIEAQRLADEERAKAEAEKRAADERARIEAQRRVDEGRAARQRLEEQERVARERAEAQRRIEAEARRRASEAEPAKKTPVERRAADKPRACNCGDVCKEVGPVGGFAFRQLCQQCRAKCN